MLFSLEHDGDVPIYEQIVAQVIYNVAAGELEVGALIPSVRKLAEQILVNPNTVARAYQQLEREGVVIERRGRGMEVTPEAPAACRAKRRELVRQRIKLALREAAASALPPEEIRRLVDEELAALDTGRQPGEKRSWKPSSKPTT